MTRKNFYINKQILFCSLYKYATDDARRRTHTCTCVCVYVDCKNAKIT